MLCVLPHGVCVDPEIVKYISIRADRPAAQPNAKMVFSVIMKTDADDHLQVIASFDDRGEAEALSIACAKRINKALGVDSEEDEASEESEESSDEDAFDFKLDDE